MDKEKEIEEFTTVIIKNCYKYDPPLIARQLVNAGYGNVEQAVKEFAEKLLVELEEQKRFYETARILHGDISVAAINYAIKHTKRLFKELYGGSNNES